MTKRQARYKVGDVIGREYKVYEVHMGGMGEVYLCLDKDKLPLALKTFQGADVRMKQLFEDETRKWIELEIHPNIVQCYWMDIFNNIPFMGLEWIAGDESRGADLRGWLRYGALDLKQALKFTIDIVRGLVYAGEKSAGIVHRDLKPDNILVTQGGLAKITDFGLATIINQTRLTSDADDNSEFDAGKSQYAGNMVGTPAYMPPEQWRGDADIDPRADMYAVGCILYEMLTGRMPYVASTSNQMRLQHLETPIPTVLNMPTEVNTIISTCMAKNRADRYPTMKALLDPLIHFYEAHIGEIIPPMQVDKMDIVDYNNRGITYANLKLYDLAIIDFNEAIRLDPNDAGIYTNRGNAYDSRGMYDHAIADYDEAIHLDPNLAIAYINRGVSYDNKDMYDHAIANHDKAIRLNPNLDQAYYNRGNSYRKKGMIDAAISDFNTAIYLNPSYALAWFNKGAVYANTGRLQEALACLERAYELGFIEAMGAIHQVKQAIVNTTHPSSSQNLGRVASQAFLATTSLDAMRHVVAQYPKLITPDFIQLIQQVIQTQIPPELKPEVETRLAWLIQIAKGE